MLKINLNQFAFSELKLSESFFRFQKDQLDISNWAFEF